MTQAGPIRMTLSRRDEKSLAFLAGDRNVGGGVVV